MDISKLSLVELKALAFDLINQIQLLNNNLMILQYKIKEKLEKDRHVKVEVK